MADTAPLGSTAATTSPGSVEPAERGKLTVQDRVVERLATYAALGVPGVVRHGDVLDKAVGRRLPRVDAHISGRVAAVDLDLAVRWGSSLEDVTSSVRQTVREKLESLAGLEVTRVNITVKRIVRDRAQEARVR